MIIFIAVIHCEDPYFPAPPTHEVGGRMSKTQNLLRVVG